MLKVPEGVGHFSEHKGSSRRLTPLNYINDSDSMMNTWFEFVRTTK